MYRLQTAAIIGQYVSEHVKELYNYTAVAMYVITKCMADSSPLYKVHVNFASE